MYEKLFRRLTKYAVKHGHIDFASDFCQYVVEKHLMYPESNYITKPANWLLTDFLREMNGGGRIRDNIRNDFVKATGKGTLDRKATIPGLYNYSSLIEWSSGKERFCSEDNNIDDRLDVIKQMNKVKNYVRGSGMFKPKEIEIFELLLLDFRQMEIKEIFGLSESRMSQIVRKVFKKIRETKKLMDLDL